MAACASNKTAGLLLGLFVCLAFIAVATPGRTESVLDTLKKLEKQAPPPPAKTVLLPLRLQVEKAEATLDAATNEPVVLITMSPRSGRLFYELTRNNIGRRLALRIDGQVVAEPVIREAIANGVVQISGSLTVKDAADLAARLNRGEARVEVELVDG